MTGRVESTSSAIRTDPEELARYRDELFEFLRIPSVSAKIEHRADTRRAGGWVVERLARAGLRAELLETAGHPVAFGEWRGAGPNAPTLLVYGHYDVQPPEPVELWTTPPFEPTLRDGRIYARGAADDKGQVFLHLKALEILLGGGGTHGGGLGAPDAPPGARAPLRVNVVVLIEGEEEIASPNLLPFLEANRERLRAEAVVVSDTAMLAEGRPTLMTSLRGLAYFEVRVRGSGTDLHSGSYGGAVPNAATELARMIATFHDATGRIAIAGFYDSVRGASPLEIAAIRALPHRDEDFLAESRAVALKGEAGRSTLERLWIRPTCEVNGLLSGYTGEGAKTVLPAWAMAKVSFRLVPDQDPAEVERHFRAHLRSVAPPEVEVEVTPLHGGRPWRAETTGRFFEAARAALRETFEVEPILAGDGASIPIVTELERVLGARAVLMGFAPPGANMHAPDEWFPERSVGLGVEALVRFYRGL